MKKIFLYGTIVIFTIFVVIFSGIINNYYNAKKVNYSEDISITETIYVYFPGLPDMDFVGEEFKFEGNVSIEEKVRQVMKKLMDGPENQDLIPVIPKDTILNKVRVKDNIVYLDFSVEFVENHPGGSVGEYNTLYSIVNSLTEIDGIEGVDFSIQGKKLETYKGHCEFAKPLYRDL